VDLGADGGCIADHVARGGQDLDDHVVNFPA
jgi:hypothetical protein